MNHLWLLKIIWTLLNNQNRQMGVCFGQTSGYDTSCKTTWRPCQLERPK